MAPSTLATKPADASRPFAARKYWVGFREEQSFLVVAVIIGIFSGLSVVLFRVFIESTRIWLLGSALEPPVPRVILVPTVTGLVVALLVIWFFPRVRGSGINQTKAAVYIYDGYIPFNTVGGKFLTSALAIGSGQSLGPEDPALQIGAGLASALGRRLQLTREKLRLLAPVGAAAGLAAAFNTPITAVLFVIEEVIGRWSAGILGAVVLSAVSSVVVERWFFGDAPLFRIPSYHLDHPGELLAYAILGVVGGLSSLLFVKLVGALRPRLKNLPQWSQYLQPAAAGLLIGVTAVWFPQIMGAGYEVMDQAMHGQFSWKTLALLAILKLLATTISFVAGTPGGLYAPTLFMGAMIGGAVGALEKLFFPEFSVAVGAYALVGMGTLFAGILRAPMTSVFMILEVSGNYSIILPVMISNTIAYLISRGFQPTPLFDVLSRQDGLDLPSMEEQRESLILRVEDAMRPPQGMTVKAEESVSRALELLQSSGKNAFLVKQDKGGWNIVTRDGLKAALAEGKGDLPLRKLDRKRVPQLHPDHQLDAALRHIQDWPLLPVVHRANFQQLVGVISLNDIVQAYRSAAASARPEESEGFSTGQIIQ